MRHGYLSKWNELSITTAKENRTTQTTSVTIYKNCISCMNIYNANKNRDRNKMRISKLQGNKVKDNESINKNLLQFSNRGSTWVCRNPPGGRHLNFRMSIKKMQKYLTGLFPTYIYPINKAFLTVRLCFENIYVKNPVFSQTPYQLVRLFHPLVHLIVQKPPQVPGQGGVRRRRQGLRNKKQNVFKLSMCFMGFGGRRYGHLQSGPQRWTERKGGTLSLLSLPTIYYLLSSP